MLREQKRSDVLLLFWHEVKVHTTLHHHSKLFSTAILGFYLHSDLANYSVAYLSEALIFLQVCENTVLLLIACNTRRGKVPVWKGKLAGSHRQLVSAWKATACSSSAEQASWCRTQQGSRSSTHLHGAAGPSPWHLSHCWMLLEQLLAKQEQSMEVEWHPLNNTQISLHKLHCYL